MLCGRTLQTALHKRDKFVLTTKLIEGTDGRKMSKTYDNCIWIDDSPADMYGKIMSMKDDLILPYFECVTEVPTGEIGEIEKKLKSKGTNPRDMKMRLAREVVTLYHGGKSARDAEENFANVFSKHGTPDEMPEVKAGEGTLLVDLLVAGKFVKSKSEARRLIEQGGMKINDATVTHIDAKAVPGIVKVGKRMFVRIQCL
jgi:tyrosyl-tRNA synthetase